MYIGNSANWDTGKIDMSKRKWETKFLININGNEGQFVGNNGSSDVIILQDYIGMHFIEKPLLGGMNITTLYNNSNACVHTRLLSIGGPCPSQYYGYYKIIKNKED